MSNVFKRQSSVETKSGRTFTVYRNMKRSSIRLMTSVAPPDEVNSIASSLNDDIIVHILKYLYLRRILLCRRIDKTFYELGTTALKTMKKLERLNLHQHRIQNALHQIQIYCGRLQVFHLDGYSPHCPFNVHVQDVYDVIKYNKNISELQLTYCNFLTPLSLRQISTLSKLSTLTISAVPKVYYPCNWSQEIEYLKKCNNLTSLNMYFKLRTTLSVEHILTCCPSLHSLSCGNLAPNCATLTTKFPNVRKLSLCRCRLVDKELQSFPEYFPNLRNLDLSDNDQECNIGLAMDKLHHLVTTRDSLAWRKTVGWCEMEHWCRHLVLSYQVL